MSERGSLAAIVLIAVALAANCRRPPAVAPSPPSAAPWPSSSAPETGALALPEIVGFAAGETWRAAGYVRRTYTRGRARIEVTLARMPMSPDDYASWVKISRASFPQAALDVPLDEANGFYQCSDGPSPSCDLLVQLRAGVHLEIRSSGTASRAEVDALAHGLPMRQLAGLPSR